MNNNTTTFWNFLQENTIEIPIIQRDFAQGRTDKSHIRNSFLTNLKQALDNNLPNREQTLKLDFVYGSVEHGKLNPLDGQQRLTTLWLLHWYVALKAGKLAEATDVLKKFTYETRITSREFCQQLCNADNFKDYAKNSIVDYIASRTWFYSAWKQDPTIQSMLTMLRGTKETDKNGDDILDGIEELFVTTETENFVEYWERLTSEDAPIVFYYLPLQDFGLSDDLYIKMNARGKQLTSFENFKADLIGYIEQQARDNKDWEILLDPQFGLPIKLDTVWMDIFWNNKSVDSRVDEIYFSFLNRFFWNELFIAKNGGQYLLDIGKGEEGGNKENENASYRYLNGAKPSYPGFDAYKYFNKNIPIEFFFKLGIVLDRYIAVPKCNWDSNFHFIPQYTEDGKVTNLTQPHRVVFFAICKYFKEGESEEISLKRWLRVVWNLVSGEDENGRAEIRSTSAMRTAIEFISKIDSHNVYESLSKLEVTGNSVFDERCKEEIAKVEKILEDINWEKKIIQAESYAFFKGTIRFLFRDEDGDWNWDDFDTKWENAQMYFDKDKFIGLVELTKYCSDKEIECFFQKWSFSKKNWAKILQDNATQKPVHNFLLKTNKATELTLLQKDLENLLQQTGDDVWLLKDWLDCRWVLTNYSQRRSEPFKGWVYEVNNLKRAEFNKVLNSSQDISVCGPEAWGENFVANDGTAYCKGLWTDFTYHNTNFQYYSDIIYLMDENWDYVIKDDKASTEEEKYCCFNAKEIVAPKQFIEHLNGLIKEHESRCAQCTGKICE